MKLKELYQTVSKSTGYKALLLKGPFQKNVFYLTQMSSLANILNRLKQFYSDLNATVQETERLLKDEPNLNNVFKMMSLIQRAKVDIALIKSTLAQADELEENMVKNKPSASCPGDPLKIVEGILKSKSISDVAELRRKAKAFGGLDGVVKCLIARTIDQFAKRYEDFKANVLKDLKVKEKKLKELEELAKLLSIS